MNPPARHRDVRDLNERERAMVIDAVNTLIRAQTRTGVSAAAIDRIVRSHRKASKRPFTPLSGLGGDPHTKGET